LGSLVVSTQPALPQHVSPAPHGGPPLQKHVPPEQVSPAPHARPHALQFAASFCRSLQPIGQHCWEPLHPALPAHRHVVPTQVLPFEHAGEHVVATQRPAVHVVPLPQPGALHDEPQCTLLVCKLKQPSPQHVSPATHACPAPGHTQPPAPLHCSPDAHELVQLPQ
jgi:hypothetical protein